MRKKNNTRSDSALKSSVGTHDHGRSTAPIEDEKTSFPVLDFLSPEFNTIDDLDDNRGDYRSFESLDGIVTSDMRYHAERKKLKNPPPEDEAEPARVAGDTAGGTKEIQQTPPPPLTIVSKGRTLIIGPDLDDVLDCGEHLAAQGLTCTLCVPAVGSSGLSFSRTASFALVEADSIAVAGTFGGFSVTTGASGDQTDFSALLGEDAGFFDIILDLQATPSYSGRQLPIGYFAPGQDTGMIAAALQELPGLRGNFTRPQFTLFRDERCLHGRSSRRDCRKCLEICPVAAIKSVNRKIAIDPYLCQGCGGCALVCPADAVLMQAPAQEDLLSELGGLLSRTAASGNRRPDLVILDQYIENRAQRPVPPSADTVPVIFKVDEIGRFGLETILSGLAYGAASVTLICDRDRPTEIIKALERQAELGRLILQGLGLEAERIRFIVHGTGNDAPEETHLPAELASSAGPVEPLFETATFSFKQDNQTLVRLAAQHLYAASGSRQPAIVLPSEAPFGAVAIDPGACSLCMACAGACPTRALSASGEEPRLSFVESRCHQCGLCAAACPEQAVHLLPRLLCDPEAADAQVVLHEVEPFCCIECGEPFASQAMVSRMQEKLSGHWMYSSDQQVRRLQMCRTCRTRDALTAGDYR